MMWAVWWDAGHRKFGNSRGRPGSKFILTQSNIVLTLIAIGVLLLLAQWMFLIGATCLAFWKHFQVNEDFAQACRWVMDLAQSAHFYKSPVHRRPKPVVAAPKVTAAVEKATRDAIGGEGADTHVEAINPGVDPARAPREADPAAVAPATTPEPGWVETLGWAPRSFLYHGFLSPEECEHFKALAGPQLARSTAVDSTGTIITDSIRTSYGMFFDRGQDEVIARVEKRLSEWVQLPAMHGEGLQVLRYYKGQHYGPHWDLFEGNVDTSAEGERIATVVMYLHTCGAGGETAFPNAPAPDGWHESRGGESSWSECGRTGVATKAIAGDAVLFFSLTPDGKKDPASMHTGCPPTTDDAQKWVAVKWFHTRPFRPTQAELDEADPTRVAAGATGCADKAAECAGWAATGECEKNAKFMVVSCKRSCNKCPAA